MKTANAGHGAALTNQQYECPGRNQCASCLWAQRNNGHCTGCDDEYHQRCFKRICSSECSICSGGKHARVAGCCGSVPESWHEPWDTILGYNMPDYAPDPLQINCPLIPLIYAQIKNLKIPEQFPQINVWAAPIHKVADRKGKFRSNDLKDYLGLPPDRKLILSTSAPDDFQETLWEKGPEMNYARHGIDYWFPAHFSIYDNDSKLYQFASAKRQQMHALWTQSQFVWFRLGEHIPVKFLAPIRKAASVLFTTTNMRSNQNRAILRNEVKIADRWFPPQTAFFVLGGLQELPIGRERSCYEINSKWITRGVRGYNTADKKNMRFKRPEVLKNNLKEALELLL